MRNFHGILQLKFNITGSFKHTKIFHVHDSSFKITCAILGWYINFCAFVNHVSAMHNIMTYASQSDLSDHCDTTNSAENDEQSNDDFDSGECMQF